MTQYRFRNVEQGGPVRTFLDLIWAANAAAKADGQEPIFAAPTFEGRDGEFEDRYREEYPDARVLGPLKSNDDGVRVIPKTDRGAKYLRLGAIAIGYPNIPEEVNA